MTWRQRLRTWLARIGIEYGGYPGTRREIPIPQAPPPPKQPSSLTPQQPAPAPAKK